jgi:hypothetical protein
MPLPITAEIDALESQIARLQETVRNLSGLRGPDRDLLDDALKELREKTKRLKDLKKLRYMKRLKLAGRTAVYSALLYLLVAAVADKDVEMPVTSGGNGPCSDLNNKRSIKVENSSYGPKSSYTQAYEEVQAKCNAFRLSCPDEKCNSCAPDIIINTVDIKNRIFWYTTEITATCQCWCK